MGDRHVNPIIPYRTSEETREALRQAALDYNLPVNWLIDKAVHEFLERLIPPDEIKWTR